MNQDLAIGSFLHVQYPEGALQVWCASGRPLAATATRLGMSIPCGDVLYNLSKIAGVIFINDALMTLIIEFTLFAAFSHWR